MNFISKKKLKKPPYESFALGYPKVDTWMKKNCNSQSVTTALNIALMKSRVYDHSNSPGSNYWLQTANHGRLILRIGANAVQSYQTSGEQTGTPLAEAKDAMNCSMRTKWEIINGAIALGRLHKERACEDERTWVLFPSGKQLMEFINFQLHFYLWIKESDLAIHDQIGDNERALFEKIISSGPGISFMGDK